MSPFTMRSARVPRVPMLRILSQTRPVLLRSQFRATRSVSTTTVAADSQSTFRRFRNVIYGTGATVVAVFGYMYFTDTRSAIHQYLVPLSLRLCFPDAETAHHVGNVALKAMYMLGVHPRERNSDARDAEGADLSVTVWGTKLSNPIGTSAGIDKGGEVHDALFSLGPSIVEIGGVTPLPQDGNPKPRCFRLPDQKAFINRYGLNSEGADSVAKRLRERVRIWAYHHGYGFGPEAEDIVLNGEAGVPPGSLVKGKMLLVQVAKNKDTKDEDIKAVTRDYVTCVEKLAPYADILVVNVSSPNTPGLRGLQKVEPLTQILKGVVEAAHACKRKTVPKVMVKVSPDEDQDEQIEGIVEAIWKSGVDGVIVGNTTKRRDKLIPDFVSLTAKEQKVLAEQGGFSGPQMFPRTLALVKRYRKLLDQGPPDASVKDSLTSLVKSPEQKVIFATGGIWTGKQALEMLNAGASVAQVYTAMVYGGSGTICRIKKEMKEEMEAQKKA